MDEPFFRVLAPDYQHFLPRGGIGSLRNKDRTNWMLDLIRLRLNGVDDVDHYHRVLRTAAEAAGGRGSRQGKNRDARGTPSLR